MIVLCTVPERKDDGKLLAMEKHPYGIYLPKGAPPRTVLLGTFPGWEFTHSDPQHFDPKTMIRFFYGRVGGPNANLLWKISGHIHKTDLSNAESIKRFCDQQRIALTDVYWEIERTNPKSSLDKSLNVLKYNDQLVDLLNGTPSIERVLCTGTEPKKVYDRYFKTKIKRDDLQAIALISPSGAANVAIGGRSDFKGQGLTTFEYRVKHWSPYFPISQG